MKWRHRNMLIVSTGCGPQKLNVNVLMLFDYSCFQSCLHLLVNWTTHCYTTNGAGTQEKLACVAPRSDGRCFPDYWRELSLSTAGTNRHALCSYCVVKAFKMSHCKSWIYTNHSLAYSKQQFTNGIFGEALRVMYSKVILNNYVSNFFANVQRKILRAVLFYFCSYFMMFKRVFLSEINSKINKTFITWSKEYILNSWFGVKIQSINISLDRNLHQRSCGRERLDVISISRLWIAWVLWYCYPVFSNT